MSFISASSASAFVSLASSPMARSSLSGIASNSSALPSRYSVVFLTGYSSTSSNSACSVQPMRGPGFSPSFMSSPPPTFNIPTERGSRMACSIIAWYLRKRNGCSLGRPVPIRSHMRRCTRSQMCSLPTLATMRRTAESVTTAGSLKNMCQRTSEVALSIVSRGNLRFSSIFLAIRVPTTSCPWKVQSFLSSDQRRAVGLVLSDAYPLLELRGDVLQNTQFVAQNKGFFDIRREEYADKFVPDALFGDLAQLCGRAAHGGAGPRLQGKVQLGAEAHRAHNPQSILLKTLLRVPHCAHQ